MIEKRVICLLKSLYKSHKKIFLILVLKNYLHLNRTLLFLQQI